ncbi:MAG: tRNA pseudouridine(55) synthase TruB [Oscillospiraceae bacterium]|nr:tRNA pseudouridine(55) synthase TruB [Oscillospiraceae bacterium]
MPSGIVIIDKPADWTSMDVCAKLRGILKERRIGHGGTLDPMATGVLPVFVGSATKAVEFAERGGKEYIAGLRLGVVTNTQDSTGEVLETRPAGLDRAALEAVLPRFTGAIEQVPPMFSAIKIQGKKLYELARKGQEVERKPRPVTIHALEVLEQTAPDRYLLRIRCSKGTYVRTLCHDIGQALGCGGCMDELRRTMAAGFTIEQAVTLEQVQERGETLLLPMDRLFAEYPAFRLTSSRQEKACRNGSPVPAKDLEPGTYRVYGQAGDFLCLSRYEDGQLRAIKNFFGG